MEARKDSRPGPVAALFSRPSRPIRFWSGVVLLVAAFAGAYLQPTNPDSAREARPNELAWWLYPFERNSPRHLPHIDAALNDIHIVRESGDMWICGDRGFLAVSRDKGATWQQIDFAKAGDWSASALVQRSSAWWSPPEAHAEVLPPAGGVSGTPPPLDRKQRKSEPDSKSPQNVGPGKESGEKAAAISDEIPLPGRAPKPLADAGSGADSPDSESPKENSPDATVPVASAAEAPESYPIGSVSFRRVHFERANRGWVLGDDGSVLRTQDGGVTWSRTVYNYQSTAIAVGRDSEWFTTDSGQVRRIEADGYQEVEQVSSDALRDISLSADGSTAWAIGDDNLYFNDPATGWTRFSPDLEPASNNLYVSVVVSPDGKHVRILGIDGLLIRVDRAGSQWVESVASEAPQGPMAAIDMAVDASTGDVWSVMPDRILLSSSAGRAEHYVFDVASRFRAIALSADGRTVVAVGGTGAVVSVDSTGNTRVLAGGWRGDLRDIAFAADGDVGLAVGQHGELLSTIDGGATWHENSSPGVRNTCVQFVGDQSRVLIGGWNPFAESGVAEGTLRPTGWEWNYDAAAADVEAIEVHSESNEPGSPVRAWAATLRGEILVRDGEQWVTTHRTSTWDEDTNWELRSISFAPDHLHGVAVGKMTPHDPLRNDNIPPSSAIVVTSDGGRTWSRNPIGSPEALTAVTMLTDTEGWAVGMNGLALRTEDGGETWDTRDVGAKTIELGDIAFAPDRRRGWIAGAGGLILRTDNGGESWKRLPSGTEKRLSAIHVHSDGKRVWMAGDDGLVLRTSTAGESWQVASYAKTAPAPWFFIVAFLVLAFLIVPAQVGGSGSADDWLTPSIAAVAISDRPLEPGQPDRLNTRGLARGLARFLGNEATQARLTVGIMGGWGSGKSSIMNELRAELSRYGFYSAWFNAWHHQTEEHLLASLFDTIRSEALPSFWRPDLEGVRFRFRLLRIRIWRQRLPWLFFAILTTFVVGHLNGADDRLGYAQTWLNRFLEWLPFVTAPQANGPSRETSGVLALLAFLGSARLAWNGLSTFGVSPSLIVSRLTGQMHVGDLKANPGLRQQFRMVFSDVVQALHPRPLALFVDDLDRCSPERTLVILEMINFLMTAGDCYVVVGMDRERVEGCVGMAFQDVAQFVGTETATADDKEKRSRARTYARQYLDKLINIEVAVPELRPEDARNLVRVDEVESQEANGWLRLAMSFGRRFAPVTLLLMVLGGVWRAGNEVPPQAWSASAVTPAPRVARAIRFEGLIREIQSSTESERLIGVAKIFALYPEEAEKIRTSLPRKSKVALDTVQKSAHTPDVRRLLTAIFLAGTDEGKRLGSVSPRSEDEGAFVSPGAPVPAQERVSSRTSPPVPSAIGGVLYLPGEDDPSSEWLWLFAVILGGLGVSSLRLLNAPLPPERDSAKFSEALSRWIALVHLETSTPRALKRFVNRVRYYAMRQQNSESRLTPGERLRGLIGWSSPGAPSPAAEFDRIPEDVLVALSAIQHAQPKWLDDPMMWSDPRKYLDTRLPGMLTEAAEDISRHEASFRRLSAGIAVR